MPPGCAIRLDEISQGIVLENLKASIRRTRALLVDDLRGMPSSTSLAGFLEASSFDLSDVYSSPAMGTTFTSARRAAGHLRGAPDAAEREFSNAVGKMLHVDDDERHERWRSWLTASEPPAAAAAGSRDERLQWMLFAALGQRKRPLTEITQVFEALWRTAEMREELVELLDVLRERSQLDDRHPSPIEPQGVVPIQSHATYGLYELIAAYSLVSNGSLRETREGVIWSEPHKSDLFFITLNKADDDYSPTTRYQDYPISPTLFHWESQGRTTTASPTGQRYIHHVARGSRVILFVRENRRDERDVSTPYLCLGPARMMSHQSERPMRIVWELERAMPAEIYTHAKVAAG